MKLEDAATPIFARHETFHARFSWFRKAYVETRRRPDLFNRDDATLILGVGKNMVRSIRFWANAAKILTEAPDPKHPRVSFAYPTEVAAGLLGEGGLDPFMENPSTWWWLHWLTMSLPCDVPAWWLILNEMRVVEFDDDDATQFVEDRLVASSWTAPNVSSIKKDVLAFIRTYGTTAGSRTDKFDDQFGSPLRDLGLLSPSAARNAYRLAAAKPSSLKSDVVAAAVFDFLAMTDATATSVLVNRLATEPGAPGRALRCTEADILAALDASSRRISGFQLASPAGAPQLSWSEDPATLASRLMSAHLRPGSDEVYCVAGPAARERSVEDAGIFAKPMAVVA